MSIPIAPRLHDLFVKADRAELAEGEARRLREELERLHAKLEWLCRDNERLRQDNTRLRAEVEKWRERQSELIELRSLLGGPP